MDKLYNKTEANTIVYVTRDIERASGFDLSKGHTHIVTNDTIDARSTKEEFPLHITLIPSPKPLDTYELLEHKDAASALGKGPILVFKNTNRIEKTCAEKNLTLLNPSANLANMIEEKVSQVGWLADMREFLPPHEITQLNRIQWEDRPFIIQYNHAHSGEGTFFIENESELAELQSKFPQRDVRKTAYIQGPVFTSNAIVTKDKIIPGNISAQITGLKPFTDLPFATVGTDWKLAHTLLSENDKIAYRNIEVQIGEKMQRDGWLGMFGVDIVRANDGEFFLIEINARQPASASFESILQKRNTVLEAHVQALQNIKVENVLPLTRGGQISQRVTRKNEAHYPHLKYNSPVNRIKKEDYIMDDEHTVRPDIYLSQDTTFKTLSLEALKVIDSYLSFSTNVDRVSIPYYNNARHDIRGGLNVFGGKGSIEDIHEEIDILAKKEHVDLKSLPGEDLKKFLVEHNIGIDCSGLTYYILDAELRATKQGSLKGNLSFRPVHGIIGALFGRMRGVRNTNVKVLAHKANSTPISLLNIQPADLIIMTDIAGKYVHNHVLIIHKVIYKGTTPTEIHYTHTIAWSTDGKYDHGVRQGIIEITDPEKPLPDQKWSENGETNRNNETRARALKAGYLAIHRLIHN
ncbi:hypothetical protein COB55_00305 [Candidatus Wolfebacteria bacterium]|nr:MAG: hypothetical protein COB55_00305 [Candidatus Wolfebacteria bacterium]